jgi:hypothetical protein
MDLPKWQEVRSNRWQSWVQKSGDLHSSECAALRPRIVLPESGMLVPRPSGYGMPCLATAQGLGEVSGGPMFVEASVVTSSLKGPRSARQAATAGVDACVGIARPADPGVLFSRTLTAQLRPADCILLPDDESGASGIDRRKRRSNARSRSAAWERGNLWRHRANFRFIESCRLGRCKHSSAACMCVKWKINGRRAFRAATSTFIAYARPNPPIGCWSVQAATMSRLGRCSSSRARRPCETMKHTWP